jgi:ArsR family transcriptional regulator, zinc-responsive transcriptional repressor
MSSDLDRPSGVECYEAVSDFFAALASPVRAAIVHRLSEREQSVNELVEALGVSQPLVSQHLRHLRAAKIVTGERAGRQITYSLTDEHVAHVFGDAFQHTEERHHDEH